MKKREIKQKFCSKFTLLLLVLSFLVFLIAFILIKNEFYYFSINYLTNYLNYYISKYLNGFVNDLIVDGKVLLYVENDLINIYSALYIYIVSFNTIIFKIFTFIFPILVFYNSNSVIYSELYHKFSIPKITRIGINTYINNTLIVNAIYYGLLTIIPRIIYFLLLSIFFPLGISFTHYIAYSSFISPSFPYIGYISNPYVLILLDLIMAFIYGMIIYFISVLIISLTKNKPLSYLIFLFSISVLSLVPILFKQPPFIFYNSLFNYFSHIEITTHINFLIPHIILFIFLIILYLINKIILKKKVEENI